MRNDIEQMTEEFFRKHDAEYFLKTGYKSDMIEYPYHSEAQIKRINSQEIPLSNLSNGQRMKCPQFGDAHDFEEV